MNTLQLEKALGENALTKNIFLGVFTSDILPAKLNKYPAAFIANVDSSDEPGSHWLAFYLPHKYGLEFFDSYGHTPDAFGQDIVDYVSQFDDVIFNPQPVQSNVTAVCGHYCIYYIYSRCRGYTMKDIVSSFVTKHMNNDVKVYNYVTKYFNVFTQFFQ